MLVNDAGDIEMMSKDFFHTFNGYLSEFREESRKEGFEELLIALAEWRITQIVVTMLKEGITDFGPLTPRWLVYFPLHPNPKSREIFERERYDPKEWEGPYYKAYEKLYYVYEKLANTFPKDKRAIFFMHDIPPTSLFEYLYAYFFPDEPERIKEKYQGKRVSKW